MKGFQIRARPLLGTFVEVVVPKLTASHCVDAAFAAVAEIQSLLSAHDPESELSRLNLAPGSAYHPLHRRSAAVLRLARGMMHASGGIFDCTVGGELVRLGILPGHNGCQPLPRGSAADLFLHGFKARLTRPIWLTLDGIAKGYAVDLAVKALQRAGVKSGWVNAGGDLRAFGAFPFPVHQRRADGSLALVAVMENLALASSAVRASPDSRFPGWIVGDENGSRHEGVVSVAAPTAWRADALTKVASLAGRKDREALIEKLGGKLLAESNP